MGAIICEDKSLRQNEDKKTVDSNIDGFFLPTERGVASLESDSSTERKSLEGESSSKIGTSGADGVERENNIDSSIDAAAVLFGQSEEELNREFVFFKASKLFKKIDFDLTSEEDESVLREKLGFVVENGFGSVVVSACNLRTAREVVGKSVKIAVAVCYPFGDESFGVKRYAAKKAVEAGADAVVVPVGVVAAKKRKFDLIKKEFKKIVKASGKIPITALVESGVLSAEETEKVVTSLSLVGVKRFLTESGYRKRSDGLLALKNVRYVLKSGFEAVAYVSSAKSDDVVGALSVADGIMAKNALSLAEDMRRNLRY